MDTKAILKKVRKIEIKTRRLSDHVFGGEYHSTFKGRGMTFSEVREYQFGDDVRAIDWNVTARYHKPFVKVFEEERELTLMLLVDISGSEHFGTTDQPKKEVVVEIAATLAFSALQNNDKVGLILFSGEVELCIPPKKGKRHVLRIIRELLEFTPKSRQTNLSGALKFLANVLKKKAIVFVLSDFIAEDYDTTLRIVGNKHDVTGIRVFDKHEASIPNLGMIQLQDAETGTLQQVDTRSKAVRQAYRQCYNNTVAYFTDAFTKAGCGVIHCRTDESYVRKLLGYFKQRG